MIAALFIKQNLSECFMYSCMYWSASSRFFTFWSKSELSVRLFTALGRSKSAEAPAAVGELAPADFLKELCGQLSLIPVVVISPSLSGMYSLPFLHQHQNLIRAYVPVAPICTDKFTAEQYQSIKVQSYTPLTFFFYYSFVVSCLAKLPVLHFPFKRKTWATVNVSFILQHLLPSLLQKTRRIFTRGHERSRYTYIFMPFTEAAGFHPAPNYFSTKLSSMAKLSEGASRVKETSLLLESGSALQTSAERVRAARVSSMGKSRHDMKVDV